MVYSVAATLWLKFVVHVDNAVSHDKRFALLK